MTATRLRLILSGLFIAAAVAVNTLVLMPVGGEAVPLVASSTLFAATMILLWVVQHNINFDEFPPLLRYLNLYLPSIFAIGLAGGAYLLMGGDVMLLPIQGFVWALACGLVVSNRRRTVTSEDQEDEIATAVPSGEPIDSVTIKKGSQLHIIPVDNILTIQANGDYVTISSAEGSFLKEQTLKFFEENLPSDKFARVHRSCIVNLREVTSIETYGKEQYQLTLRKGAKVRVSAGGYRVLKAKLGL